jgi:hypothetical protein
VYNASFYSYAVSPPPPAGATALAADAYGACTAQLAHRYGYAAASTQSLPGMVADLAGTWNAVRVDAAFALLPGAGALTGTLVVNVPMNATDGVSPVNDLLSASGLTVRMLFDSPGGGVLPNFEWQGLGVFNTSSGATTLTNTYAGTSSSFTGPGTVTHPTLPYINGLYTTFSMSGAGTTVYVGPYVWASFPALYFAPGSQGSMSAANRIIMYNANLYDFQVYNTALSAAQVIGLSEGVAMAGC